MKLISNSRYVVFDIRAWDHFGAWRFGKRRFNSVNVSASEGCWDWEISHSCMWTLSHWDILAWGYFSTVEVLMQKLPRYRNVPMPKCIIAVNPHAGTSAGSKDTCAINWQVSTLANILTWKCVNWPMYTLGSNKVDWSYYKFFLPSTMVI